MNQFHRYESLINEVIGKLNLDLSGKVILTEVGSSLFALTPIIAIKANAKKVYAWGKDNNYGKATESIGYCKSILKECNCNAEKVEFAANNRPFEHIIEADIITNLGNVRPLDENFLKCIKRNAVIPLMCESWELRSSDIDINYCKQNSIKVAGTWENHPVVKIFEGSGYLAAKLCFNAGYELYQNKIAIWSNDDFGKTILSFFSKFDPEKLILTYTANELNQDLDFILIADYVSFNTIVGERSLIPSEYLINKGIVHLCGKVDYNFCKENNILIYPAIDGFSRKMTQTLSYLGPKSLIDLHAAGLKVGEILHNNMNDNLSSLAQPMTFN